MSTFSQWFGSDLARLAVHNALLSGVYVGVALFGLLFATEPNPVSPVWPLSGIIFLALLQGGLRFWPGVFIGELITGLWIRTPIPTEIGIAAASTLEAVIGVALLRPFIGRSLELDSLKKVLAFIAVTTLLSVPLAAAGAAFFFTLGHGYDVAYAWKIWRTWWIGDVMGVLTIAPALVALQQLRIRTLPWQRIIEGLALYGLLAAATWIVMQERFNYTYLLFIFVIWTALRFGPNGTAGAVGVVSVLTIGLTALGRGPFIVAVLDDNLFFLQTFLGVLVVTALIMSALVAERERQIRLFRLLADVGNIVTRPADEAQMLANIATRIAASVEGCCIDLLERDGRLRTAAAACSHPRCEGHVSALVQLASDPSEPYLLTRVIRQRQPLMLFAHGQDLATQIAPVGSRQAIWAAIRPRALVAVPLIAYDQPLGGMLLFAHDPTRPVLRVDVPVAQALAEQVAQALVTTRLSAELTRLNKLDALGQLASGIAHDFNNLLTVIEGHTDLALECLESSHPASTDLEAVRRAVQRAKNLVGELRSISRRDPLVMQHLDLNELVRRSEPLLRPLLGKTIELVYYLTPDPLPCLVEPAQFERVLINLVANARDAMPEGGRITISTSRCDITRPHLPELAPGRYAQLSVRDTGAGIAPEVMAHIFEPYFTTKGAGKGSGLGLAISYGLIRQMQGTITVQSEIGRGTEFVIYLPEYPQNEKPENNPQKRRNFNGLSELS